MHDRTTTLPGYHTEFSTTTIRDLPIALSTYTWSTIISRLEISQHTGIHLHFCRAHIFEYAMIKDGCDCCWHSDTGGFVLCQGTSCSRRWATASSPSTEWRTGILMRSSSRPRALPSACTDPSLLSALHSPLSTLRSPLSTLYSPSEREISPCALCSTALHSVLFTHAECRLSNRDKNHWNVPRSSALLLRA